MKKTINGKLNVELIILEKIIKKSGYESLLDFLENTNQVEHIKNTLRNFHNNKSKLFIIK